jgi:hypothetical protein
VGGESAPESREKPDGHEAGAPAPADVTHPGKIPYGAVIGAVVCTFALAVCITLIQLTHRAIMDLGGFVASGGPYAITHPAPDWTWIWPVAFIGVWVFAIAQAFFANKARAFNLLAATWCVMFLWAGISFLQYGFDPPGGGGLAWGWIVAGVTFTLTGLVPVLAIWGSEAVRSLVPGYLKKGEGPEHDWRFHAIYTGLHAVAIVAGLAYGAQLFGVITG